MQVEEEYVRNYYNRDMTEIKERLPEINFPVLSELLVDKFWDANLQNLFSDILIAIFQQGNLPQNVQLEGIRYWINSLSYLSQGQNGQTFTSTIRNMPDKRLLIKTSEDLTHEVFVGLMLNKLRSHLLNFSYVYMGFNCSSPLFVDKTFLSWCDKKTNDLGDAFYEYVYPSSSFADFVSTHQSSEESLSYYLQAVLALNYAFKKIKFTHFDLHGENVLLRELDSLQRIDYPTGKGSFVFYTKKIPTFIDYGFSSVEYKGKMYTNVPGFMEEVPFFPLYDAYRLATALYYTAVNKAPFKFVISYFGEVPSAEHILERYSALDQRKFSYKKSLDELIDYILPYLPVEFVKQEEEYTEPIYLDELGLEDPPYAKSLFQFYYLINLENRKLEGYSDKIKIWQSLFLDEIRSLNRIPLSLEEYTVYFKLYKRLNRSLDIFFFLANLGYDINLPLIDSSWKEVQPMIKQNKDKLKRECRRDKKYCPLVNFINQ